MQPINKLDVIKHIITEYSAVEYANIMLQAEKENTIIATMNTTTGAVREYEVEYEEYMQATYGFSDSTLAACIERSRLHKLEEFAKYINIYTGFVRNGQVFVLNRKEKFVSILYDTIKQDGADKESPKSRVFLYTHYNPLNVDCVEQWICSNHLHEGLLNDDYDMSADEGYMLDECNNLINQKQSA